METYNKTEEEAGRDHALALLNEYRGALISIAKRIGYRILEETGKVTSTAVWEEMMEDEDCVEAISEVDKRWMGAVFPLKGTHRIGWQHTGSHARPIAIWGLKDV